MVIIINNSSSLDGSREQIDLSVMGLVVQVISIYHS